MKVIDRSSPVPLHYQLKQILIKKLQKNEWAAGEIIPSEQELQDGYGLSRTTVRQTLGDLVNEGYLVRQRGRGTTVAQMKKVAYDPSRSVELNDYMREQGVELGWRVLGHEWARADQDIAAGLKIRRGAKTLRIRRLRLAQGRIIGYHFAHVPEKFAALVNLDALDTGGSMDYLLQLPAMQKPLVQRTLEARGAREDEAKLLKMKVGAPVLYLERIVVGIDGSPIEFLVAAFCGERFKYKITL